MKPKFRTTLALLAALVVAAVVFRQEKELYRLRSAMAELTSNREDEAVIATATNPLPADIEELRRDAAEVLRLRAEVAQLRREQAETSAALQTNIDKLAAEMSAASSSVHRRSSRNHIFGDFNSAGSASPLVSKAAALAESSPEDAARWVAALPFGEEQNQAALAVIDRWVNTDPAAAAAWTTQFAEGPLREQAMFAVARHWGQRDWNTASAWLEELPTGASRDSAIGAFVTSVDGYDIRLALEWANRMEAPESRAMRVEQTAQRWLREDNAAARAWLEKAQLPSGLAERLLSAK
jgi:hypothetical protein